MYSPVQNVIPVSATATWWFLFHAAQMDCPSCISPSSPPLHTPDTNNTLTCSTPLSAELKGLVSITAANNSSVISSWKWQRGFIQCLHVLDRHMCLCDQTTYLYSSLSLLSLTAAAKQVLMQLLECGSCFLGPAFLAQLIWTFGLQISDSIRYRVRKHWLLLHTFFLSCCKC